MRSLFPLLMTVNALSAAGQTEFIVTVDGSTGVHSILHALPGVAWVHILPSFRVVDEMNGRYIFHGSDEASNDKLYTVDLATGAIIHQPTFPVLSDPNDNVVELEFNNSTGILYGLHWDASAQTEHIVSISPETGEHTVIATVPDVRWIATAPRCTTFDEVNGRFTFRGANAAMVWRLYSVDVVTGDIVSSPLFPISADPMDNVGDLQFDNSTGTLYGLHWDNSLQIEKLVTINPYDGSYQVLSDIPGVRYMSAAPHYSTFDRNSGKFYFRGANSEMAWQLYCVDVTTGSTTITPPFPNLAGPGDNLIEMEIDNSTGTLYALHWDADSNVGLLDRRPTCGVTIHPNPFTERTTITLDKVYPRSDVSLYNAAGALVRSISFHNTSTFDLHRDQLAPGLYHMNLSTDAGNMLRTVMVK